MIAFFLDDYSSPMRSEHFNRRQSDHVEEVDKLALHNWLFHPVLFRNRSDDESYHLMVALSKSYHLMTAFKKLSSDD